MKNIIHIGLHKTATSFLQKKYFPKLKKTNFYYHNLAKIGSDTVKENIIVSSENFSGNPWNKKWLLGVKNNYHWLDFYENSVINLSHLYRENRILIVFRRHGDLLISLYKQYLHEGGVLKFEEFYGENGVIRDKDLNMRSRIDFIKKKFKEVDILIYEKFKEGGFGYLDNYFLFHGFERDEISDLKKINPGVSGIKMDLLRVLNIVYLKFPQILKNLLIKTNFTPLKIVRNRLKFWNPPKKTKFIEIRNSINTKFSDDWKYVISNSWHMD